MRWSRTHRRLWRCKGDNLFIIFNANKDWPVASAVAIVLLLVLVVPMVIYQNVQSKEAGS